MMTKSAPKRPHVSEATWCFSYLIADLLLLWRCGRVGGNYKKAVKDGREKRVTVDMEQAAAKERKGQDKFRSGVEKEKDRIRATALAELKAEAAQDIAVLANAKEFEAARRNLWMTLLHLMPCPNEKAPLSISCSTCVVSVGIKVSLCQMYL
jgi:hypothetical protein